ncbi:hypothetical protein D6789_01090, partial [Candidatus Woesearchaeota archaeon]
MPLHLMKTARKVMFMPRNSQCGARALFVLLATALIITGCTPQEGTQPPTALGENPASTGSTQSGGALGNPAPDSSAPTDELHKFSSIEELETYVKKHSAQDYERTFNYDQVLAVAAIEAPAPMLARGAAETKATGAASDYSTTNVQVEGVDEADFLKNDGEFLYILNQDKLVIVDAYPPADAEVVSVTKIPGQPQSLFLNDDRLLVFTQDYEEEFHFGLYDFMPRTRYMQRTRALLYDVSDREEPELLKNWSVSGRIFQARMIGDAAYLVTQQDVYSYGVIEPPILFEGEVRLVMPDIYYFDSPASDYIFTTVTAIDTQEEELASKTFLMGSGSALYASEDYLYIAYQKRGYYWGWREEQRERFFEAVLPALPLSVQRDIEDIRDEKLEQREEWIAIAEVLRAFYEALDEDELAELGEEISFAVREWETKRNLERSSTVIQRIAIDGLDIGYAGRGEVRGTLLNQWSMDEYEGWLRVATTLSYWDSVERESVQFNNVYTLDDDMKVRGELEQLAEGERIYAARFMGERLYLVTFRRVDPLFVIDLSNPRKPELLGKLKIPGYSSYLHPYDKDHLIGIGKEGDEDGRLGGIKIALFDVSDVEHPEEIDSVEVGSQGSDSEVLRDHKAFLFNKERGVLVIPIREADERVYDPERGYYRRKVWQGAYVFHVDDEGFKEKGRISHLDGEARDEYYWWQSPWSVRRSLWMDDVLYTVSQSKVKINDFDTLKELNTVRLPYD